MISGTAESHFSVLFLLDENTLTDLLAQCRSTNEPLTVGVIVESKDAKYKTVSTGRVSIESLSMAGDASDTCV